MTLQELWDDYDEALERCLKGDERDTSVLVRAAAQLVANGELTIPQVLYEAEEAGIAHRKVALIRTALEELT